MGDPPHFLEHPTGAFETARAALTDAIERLDQREDEDRWLTFSGQGQGAKLDSYFIVDLPIRKRSIQVEDREVDLFAVLADSQFEGIAHTAKFENGIIELSGADHRQFALFIDALFRHLGIRPWDDGGDYAIGAEW